MIHIMNSNCNKTIDSEHPDTTIDLQGFHRNFRNAACK